MYRLTFNLIDANNVVIASFHTIQEIADIFNDQNILNCNSEADLSMYLLRQYFHHVINNVEFYYANMNINNTDMTFEINYKTV